MTTPQVGFNNCPLPEEDTAMTLASILRVSGGNDLVEQLSPLPTRRVFTRDLHFLSLRFVNSITTHDPVRQRKRRVPL